jgi:hypothetical protein
MMFQKSPPKRKSGAGAIFLVMIVLIGGAALVTTSGINGNKFGFFDEDPKPTHKVSEDDPKRPIFVAIFTGDTNRKAGDPVTAYVAVNGVSGRAFLLYKKSWLSQPYEKKPGLTLLVHAESRNPTELFECSLYTANKAGMFVLLDQDQHEGPGEVECYYKYQPD